MSAQRADAPVSSIAGRVTQNTVSPGGTMSKLSLTGLLSAAVLTAAAALSVPVATMAGAPAGKAAGNAGAKSTARSDVYIVRLAEEPVVAYDGGIKGYAATKIRKGQKLDPLASDVVKYKSFLTGRHNAVLNAVGGGKKLYSYGYAFNGFAAKMTDAQATKLATMRGVLSIEKDEVMHLDTSSTPDFLGLTGANGFYNTTGARGENVIIGMVDSGVWPESLSFSDRTGTNGNATKDGKLAYQQMPGWHGKCQPGELFNAAHCNQKLIGARYYNAGWGGNSEIDRLFPFEFKSPRDWAGHGTHTSSTAGGNANVPATGPGAVFGNVNGIAPRARIAAYKVCWADQPTGGGCFSSDSVAAIDQAVADGVDVINFSISGSRTNFLDSVEVAFLFAADAGVFVAASAGNAGPTTSTVAHPGPWLTTVAAGTHNRNGEGSVTLGNAVTYPGASFATALGSTPLVDSAGLLNPDYVHEPVDGIPDAATAVELCVPGSLDPARAAGKIVLCKRGVIALVDKSLATAQAGGIGAVIYNDPVGATNTLALFHSVPTVHVVAASGLAIKAYIAAQGAAATASIAQATVVFDAPAPLTASFSSRGPLIAGAGDLLKPDIIAPGQDILAAVAPPNNLGRDFDLYSGTSMSSPHVAGLAALLTELHPNWSPMAKKSALMTTATDILDGVPGFEAHPLVLFRGGAGHVNPIGAANPGLVYDSGFLDWLAFLCGTTTGVNPATCTTLLGLGYSFNPSDLNVPSIAIGDLPGSQTVRRRVTNVGSGPATYRPSVQDMAGFTVTIMPDQVTLNPGQSADFEVTLTRNTAVLNQYAFGNGGFLIWTEQGGAGRTVRIPMVARPVALAAPVQVSGAGESISYDVVFGYDGAFTATARGLVAAQTTSQTVLDDPTNSTCSLNSPNAYKEVVAIPAGTTYARFSLFDEFTDGNDDLDMCVFRGTTLVGSSGSGTSAEEVNLLNPAADNYTVVVQGWGTDGPDAQFTLFKWLLGSTAAGNMTVTAPAAATTGATGTITLDFTGLTAGTKYLGSVAYSGIAGLPNPTIVRVDP
jgi:Subtilase family/Fibronectin type-III domain/Peptidase inhibitor I9/PA domain